MVASPGKGSVARLGEGNIVRTKEGGENFEKPNHLYFLLAATSWFPS